MHNKYKFSIRNGLIGFISLDEALVLILRSLDEHIYVCADAITIIRHQCCDSLLIQMGETDGEELW